MYRLGDPRNIHTVNLHISEGTKRLDNPLWIKLVFDRINGKLGSQPWEVETNKQYKRKCTVTVFIYEQTV
jgi:hypothetical protein